jgi:uncharacterized protein
MKLSDYIFKTIVPKYAGFDAAHKEEHALTVIGQALELEEKRHAWLDTQSTEDIAPIWSEPINRDMLMTAAACHDLGLVNGRERHHLDSGEIIRADRNLLQWFTAEQIETIAQAAEDHRASGKTPPRSIYGMLIAEADRVIDQETIIRRTIQFGQKHYPELDHQGHMDRAVAHLKEKYGRGGYLKLWIPWSDNAVRLAALQDLIADTQALRKEVERISSMISSTVKEV